MPTKDLKETFFKLVRLGVGSQSADTTNIPEGLNWVLLQTISEENGVSAIVLDGLDRLPSKSYSIPVPLKKQWIGQLYHIENKNSIQWKSAVEMAQLFREKAIRTYVLKGQVIAECYPKPNHRSSSDMDCYLLSLDGNPNAWESGNSMIESRGFEVKRNHYKNSTFYLPGLMVENHKFLTPFRGNRHLTALEVMLQRMIYDDKGDDCFEGAFLFKPPVMVSSLFLIEHAYSHFLHEGLTWRHILDWMMFSKRHNNEIDWQSFSTYVDEFGFRLFYNSFVHLGGYLLGELQEDELSDLDKMMLADVWAPLDIHPDVHGWKSKLVLARNTWRAGWKYRHFSKLSMIHALWIQVKGFLFMRHPELK